MDEQTRMQSLPVEQTGDKLRGEIHTVVGSTLPPDMWSGSRTSVLYDTSCVSTSNANFTEFSIVVIMSVCDLDKHAR